MGHIKHTISLLPSTKNVTLNNYNYDIKNGSNFVKKNKTKHQKKELKTLFRNIRLNYYIKNIKSEGLPGLSVKIFKKFFLTNKWPYLTHQKHSFVQESYYGGNILHHKLRGKRLFYYDINSLYPYSLINKFPIRQPKFKKLPELSRSFGFIKAVISNPNFMSYGFLPRRKTIVNSVNQKTWIGTYFSEELKFAESIGYSITPIEGLIYDSKDNMLLDFILYMYNLKGKHPIPTKTLLNSFYGKLSYGNSNALKFSNNPVDVISRNPYLTNNKKLASTIIAAATTSYARIIMFKKMSLTNNPPQYSDTDSFIAQHKIDANKTHQKKIGLFKNTIHTKKKNKAFLSSILLNKPRSYSYSTLKNTIHHKGVNFMGKKTIKPHPFYYPIIINGKLINSVCIIELI